ncbi:MAG: TadE/TadG family protein [Pirellulales bacterium]|nr:TadE/TadG family protein [Pirellulales bacterium]
MSSAIAFRVPLRARRYAASRSGNIIVLTAVLMIVMMAFIAFAIDVGYMGNTQTELRRATDAGALAGAGKLVDGVDAARPVVVDFVQRNLVGARTPESANIQVTAGAWDSTTRTFQESNESPSALRVVVSHPNQPLFFGRVLGKDSFSLAAEAIAQYQPRDIMVVLDLSGSMNYDSTWRGFRQNGLSQSHVETNMAEIWSDLGQNVGNALFQSDTLTYYSSAVSNNTIKTNLGLRVGSSDLAYPFPSGSWDDYVNYVKGTSAAPNSLYDSVVYRRKFGYKTWVQYLLDRRSSHTQTPALANVRAQPVTALKDAVQVFLSYMRQIQTEDRLGLAVYDSPTESAVLEVQLTPNLDAVDNIVRTLQAGHYARQTNIGAGMQSARLELQNNARPGAFRMMVLMTDGQPNRPTNVTQGTALVNSEAALCAAAHIPVVTISLGGEADTALMQSVADTTRGAHFNIPGGQTASEYEEQLIDVFGQVAATRPLKLVQ